MWCIFVVVDEYDLNLVRVHDDRRWVEVIAVICMYCDLLNIGNY